MNFKTLGLISLLIILLFIAVKVLANVKAERIKVNVSEKCVEKIETAAASVEGVISTNWDKEEKELEIVFEENKTSLTEIEQAISEAGFSTPNYEVQANAQTRVPRECRIRHAITFNTTSFN